MRVGVVGTGYVGLTTGVGLAEHGNSVQCMDVNPTVVARLNSGIPTIHEEGLPDALRACLDKRSISFTGDLGAISTAEVVFLCLPTPESEDGSADVRTVLGVAGQLAELITKYTVAVNKSTVPVGTAAMVRKTMLDKGLDPALFDVVSNPEFLQEGQALGDVRRPSRVVIGTNSKRAADLMLELYEPFVRSGNPIRVMSPQSAELTKYGANGLLATRVSYFNELAALAAAVGADITDVARAMGDDPRIGHKFSHVSPGWGGSCFPKDSRALIHTGEQHGVSMRVMEAADRANDAKYLELPRYMAEVFGEDLSGMTFALWGLAFKKGTDDMRESPAVRIANELLRCGAGLRAYDPAAMERAEALFGSNECVELCPDMYSALDGANGLVIATEWDEFTGADLKEVKRRLAQPYVFDGRNLLNLDVMRRNGFYYRSNGRPLVNALASQAK